MPVTLDTLFIHIGHEREWRTKGRERSQCRIRNILSELHRVFKIRMGLSIQGSSNLPVLHATSILFPLLWACSAKAPRP